MSLPAPIPRNRAPHAWLHRLGRGTLKTVAFLVAGSLVLASLLPVILLPFATAVPLGIGLGLVAADAGLLTVLVRQAGEPWQQAATVAGLAAVSVLAILLSHAFAATPPILGDDELPLPGSIASLERVELNGSRQWVSIRGRDVRKPVLLFLAGGPGGSQLATTRRTLAGLEDHFVMVGWEQPGAGKSFGAVDRSTLTPERYVQDGLALVHHLRERFGQEKVYLLGESWGSVLGILMVQREPRLFHAFAGTGQLVAVLETDRRCYDFALRWARERGDRKKVEKLVAQGPPPYRGVGVALKQAAYLADTYLWMNRDPAIPVHGFDTLGDLAAGEYGYLDKLNWARGPLETLDRVYPHLWDLDLRRDAPQLEVPVYFLLGRHDVNTPPDLAEEYLELLAAPHKELVWFERSGHSPWASEPARFVEAMVERVLAGPPPGKRAGRRRAATGPGPAELRSADLLVAQRRPAVRAEADPGKASLEPLLNEQGR